MSSDNNKAKKIEEFKDLLSDALKEQGIEFLHLEYAGDMGGPVLRVYIDTPHGVSLEDCEKAAKIIDPIVDDVAVEEDKYSLEISSPGVDRLLFGPEDFKRFIGSKIKVKLNQPIEGRSNFTGELKDANDLNFMIVCDGAEYAIDHANVKRANIIAELNFK